jgi:hypothetical protein
MYPATQKNIFEIEVRRLGYFTALTPNPARINNPADHQNYPA